LERQKQLHSNRRRHLHNANSFGRRHRDSSAARDPSAGQVNGGRSLLLQASPASLLAELPSAHLPPSAAKEGPATGRRSSASSQAPQETSNAAVARSMARRGSATSVGSRATADVEESSTVAQPGPAPSPPLLRLRQGANCRRRLHQARWRRRIHGRAGPAPLSSRLRSHLRCSSTVEPYAFEERGNAILAHLSPRRQFASPVCTLCWSTCLA
jgi:hypothetical protein